MKEFKNLGPGMTAFMMQEMAKEGKKLREKMKKEAYEIVKWPHEALTTVAEPVAEVDDEVRDIVRRMFITLALTKTGVGLAANQVNILKQILVVKITTPIVLINPEVIKTSKTTNVDLEGCLSFPKIFEKVERFDWVKVSFLDLQGAEHKVKFRKFEGRVIQHELDHLKGFDILQQAVEKAG